mmetsp:Transcript_5144/g.15692  ORF Transcript_5144/g.15692 Transcript_5144/m.15692 type:complete len:306 (+) Transcript_5144:115-1032(+)
MWQSAATRRRPSVKVGRCAAGSWGSPGRRAALHPAELLGENLLDHLVHHLGDGLFGQLLHHDVIGVGGPSRSLVHRPFGIASFAEEQVVANVVRVEHVRRATLSVEHVAHIAGHVGLGERVVEGRSGHRLPMRPVLPPCLHRSPPGDTRAEAPHARRGGSWPVALGPPRRLLSRAAPTGLADPTESAAPFGAVPGACEAHREVGRRGAAEGRRPPRAGTPPISAVPLLRRRRRRHPPLRVDKAMGSLRWRGPGRPGQVRREAGRRCLGPCGRRCWLLCLECQSLGVEMMLQRITVCLLVQPAVEG